MILVDSNVPMYLVGAEHPHKTDAQRLLERLTMDKRRLVSDAEVLQEILHRYVLRSARKRSFLHRHRPVWLTIEDGGHSASS